MNGFYRLPLLVITCLLASGCSAFGYRLVPAARWSEDSQARASVRLPQTMDGALVLTGEQLAALRNSMTDFRPLEEAGAFRAPEDRCAADWRNVTAALKQAEGGSGYVVHFRPDILKCGVALYNLATPATYLVDDEGRIVTRVP